MVAVRIISLHSNVSGAVLVFFCFSFVFSRGWWKDRDRQLVAQQQEAMLVA